MVIKKIARFLFGQINTIVLDAGHGSVDPETGSDEQALSRKYVFPHNRKAVYEGEINRLYVKRLSELLKRQGYRVVLTTPDHHDTSLKKRVHTANQYTSDRTYFLSIHCNASHNHDASGTEGYTSSTNEMSSFIMSSILKELRQIGCKIRTGVDGLGKKRNFYVIYNTLTPSGLLEIDFYDNWDCYVKLTDAVYIDKVCKSIVKGLINVG